MPAFLGAIASALPGVATSVLGVVGNLLGSVVSTAGNILSGALTAAANLATTVIGAVVRAVIAIPGMLLNAVTGIVSALNNGGGAIVGALLKIGSVLGGLIAGALAGFAKYLQLSVKSMMDFSRSVQGIRSLTGQSYGSAAGTLQGYKILGISAESVNSMLSSQNPAILAAKARAYGFGDPRDPGQFAISAVRYQTLMGQGTGGQIQAQMYLRNLGMDNAEFRSMLMQRPETIRSQQAYGAGIDARVGVGGGAYERYAEGVSNSLTRISYVLDMLKMKAATVLLPVLESVLDAVTSFASAHVGDIGNALQAAVQWIFVKAPLLAVTAMDWIADKAATLVDRITDFAGYLATNLPQILSSATNWIADFITHFALQFNQWGVKAIEGISALLTGLSKTFAGWLAGFGKGLADMEKDGNPLYDLLYGLAQTFDFLSVGLKGFTTLAAHTGAVITVVGKLFYDAFQVLLTLPRLTMMAIGGIVRKIPDWAGSLPGVGPFLIAAKALANAWQPTDWRPVLDLDFPNYATTQAMLDNMPTSDLVGALLNAKNSGAWGKNGAAIQKRAAQIGNTKWIDDAEDEALKRLFGITGGIIGVANRVRPKGMEWGQMGQPYMQEFFNFMQNIVQPNVHAAKAEVDDYKQSLGTEMERTRRIQEAQLAVQKETLGVMKQAMQAGGGFSDADLTGAIMLQRFLNSETRAIRSNGGGSAG